MLVAQGPCYWSHQRESRHSGSWAVCNTDTMGRRLHYKLPLKLVTVWDALLREAYMSRLWRFRTGPFLLSTVRGATCLSLAPLMPLDISTMCLKVRNIPWTTFLCGPALMQPDRPVQSLVILGAQVGFGEWINSLYQSREMIVLTCHRYSWPVKVYPLVSEGIKA